VTRALRHPLTWIAILAAAVVAFAAVALVRGDDTASASAASTDPHAVRSFPAGKRDRIVNAIEAVNQSTDQAELIARGRELFRSNALAKSGESCQGCHTDGGANADIGTTPHKVGAVDIAGDFDGLRDPPSLYRVGRTAPYFWIGNVATPELTAAATINNYFADNGGGVGDPGDTGQKGIIDAIGMTPADAAAALAAYMRTFEAPEGDFLQGTLSASARNGQVLYQGKANCVACHIGPEFTDNRLHDIFVPQVVMPGGGNATDTGAKKPTTGGGVCPKPPDPALPALPDPLWCAFNTPTLLGVSGTAPYMHNGALATLEAVVQFHSTQSIIAPLGLSVQEQADLVEFLKSL
jgi:cytochrome c peroxidase